MIEKVLDELFGTLLRVAKAFRYPFQFGSVTFHVERGGWVRTEYNISIK
jgi:hypothetical protein